ncbi:DMT family transporter [Planctobacterium marinum]|uniref:DMT family transporter n=1 Tax=Planctobacterium marinum TaxID=1631968 RepID=UPI00226D1348|nr:DMT family transporter [Planctobacterium marinum]
MIGEIAALSTALCWAVASRMFQILGKSFSPLALNFWKGLVAAIVLFAVTHFFYPDFTLTQNQVFWLLLSGAIGIGLGDTFFFQALNKIGDSQAILIAETLAPIITALFAMAWIAEWLTWQQWLGIAVVILSVDMVIKLQKKQKIHHFEMTGYVYAALAAVCQAFGAVISRDILTSTDIDPANASQIRLLGGMAIIVVLMMIKKDRWLPKTDTLKQTWLLFAGATIIGTFAALFLQMLAFTYTKAAVVQTLFATSVILSLGVSRIMGEKVSGRVMLWSMVALAGVVFLVAIE